MPTLAQKVLGYGVLVLLNLLLLGLSFATGSGFLLVFAVLFLLSSVGFAVAFARL